jgi:hypothetical protein
LAESSGQWSAQQAAAMRAVDAYIDAFNARDARAFVDALHYPHMRVDGLGNPRYWASADDYLKEVEFDTVQATGWSHSRYDDKKVVQSGRHKVHVLVSFTRYDKDDKPLHTQESLYVVTEHDGRWAIQVRSSYVEQVMQDQCIGSQSSNCAR